MSVEQSTLNQLAIVGIGVLIAIPVAIALAGSLIAGFFALVVQTIREATGKGQAARKGRNAAPSGATPPKASSRASFRLCLAMLGAGGIAGGIGALMIAAPGFFVVGAQLMEMFINVDFTDRQDVLQWGRSLMVFGAVMALLAGVLYVILRQRK